MLNIKEYKIISRLKESKTFLCEFCNGYYYPNDVYIIIPNDSKISAKIRYICNICIKRKELKEGDIVEVKNNKFKK